MIKFLNRFNDKDILNKESLPHCSNLLHQLKKHNLDEGLYTDLLRHYLEVRKVMLCPQNGHITEEELRLFIYNLVEKTNLYYTFVSNVHAPHQSDFKSSILQEVICKILKTILFVNNVDL